MFVRFFLTVALAEVTCSPLTVTSRFRLYVSLPEEKLHFQVPASELDTGFSWAKPDPSVFPSGLVHCAWACGSGPLTSQWSVASLPCRRTWEGVAQTEREGVGGQIRDQDFRLSWNS